MDAISPPTLPFAQGEDASRLQAVVDYTTHEVNDCFLRYEEHRKLVEMKLSALRSPNRRRSPLSTSSTCIKDRRLDDARVQEVHAMCNLIIDVFLSRTTTNALHAQAATCAFAIAVPGVVATTPNKTTSAAEKKMMKSK